MDKKVAILMSTYNGARFIEAQIKSIQQQDYTNWHLYIRDDGSSDATLDIVSKIASIDKRITICCDDEKHRGVTESFMWLLRETSAEYYMFCDQDDVWLPTKVSETISILANIANGQASLVHSDLKVVDESLHEIHPSYMSMTRRQPEKGGELGYSASYPCVTGCAMAFNDKAKEVALQYKLPHCHHDRRVHLSVILAKGKVKYLDKATILYRQHGGNVIGARSESAIISKLKNARQRFNKSINLFVELKKVSGVPVIKFILNKAKYGLLRIVQNKSNCL